MMRRLIEISIIEAFEHKSIADKIKDDAGNYLQLSDLVQRAVAETSWRLSRNTKKYLPQLREVGHMSAHGRYYHARKEDIEKIRQGCRVVVEEFLHHAELL
jgi:putative heme degradation protein